MGPALLRMAVLLLVGGGAWFLVGRWQRRRGPAPTVLPPGITVLTGPGCALCGPVERALLRAGAAPRVADIHEVDLSGPPIRSLPVALVVDHEGGVVMRRSGRAALDDAAALADRASAL
ncbi:MAG: hypothetical protein KJP22_06390 [Acidimicrobiia bacterium]|nr:hypothetical protein [Acidimicrobiia bacterium]RZV46986.1 MAG: hypothetical protein EX267_02310 [Acidimicrobiia bacterium]